MQAICKKFRGKNERETGNKRDLILNSAFELFYQKGYQRTKIQDIARHADIGKGTFYEYFQSKDTLLEELLHLKIKEDQETLDRIRSSPDTTEEKIKIFYTLERQNMEEYGPRSNVLAQEMMSPDFSANHEVQGLIHRFFKVKHQFLQLLLEDGIRRGEVRKTDPVVGATALLGAISFYTMFQLPTEGHPGISTDLPEDSMARDPEFFRILFSGIGAVSDGEK